jgi:hypothetical protein
LDATERAFDAWARTRGGKAAALRSLIRDAVGAPVPDRPPADAGLSDLHVRLSEPEREALRQAAAQKGMAPSTWVRSLVRAHVLRRPQWGEFERQGFAAVLIAKVPAEAKRHAGLRASSAEDADRTGRRTSAQRLAAITRPSKNICLPGQNVFLLCS